jgi:hypothetical protein
MQKRLFITIILFFWFFIPFILITDFYPFFRFGMFAEPIKKEIQQEKLFIFLHYSSKDSTLFKSQDFGLDEYHFNYILRYSYYQNKMEVLAKEIKTMYSKRKTSKKLFKKISFWQTFIQAKNNKQKQEKCLKIIYF